MHYAEGSAMFLLLLALMAGFMGDGADLIRPRIDSEIATTSATSSTAQGRSFFVANDLSPACAA